MPPKKAAPAPPPKADDQVLGPKDQTLFKQVFRFYELKQYKKALRSADAILKKNPTHGETLAMKGLTLNQMKKKEEGLACIKKGLAMNIKSHICWHVYGLQYRADGLYEDAIKCYQNALKRDANNLQILKDLSNLQIQRRMLDGFAETRRRILVLKSNNKHNWLAFAISNHLLRKYDKALQILDALGNTEGAKRAPNDRRPITFDESEMHLYRVMLLDEAGKDSEALAYLQANAHEILDKLYAAETRGQLHLRLGQRKESEDEYRKLIAINPEHYAYHIGLLKALGHIDAAHPERKSFLKLQLSAEQRAAVLKLYAEDPLLSGKDLAKSAAVQRLPLNFAEGDEFRTRVSAYLRAKISRGIPSLFSDLEPLYADADKARIIGELMEGFLANLRAANKFLDADAKDSESPSSLMYALYFQAQHYDHLNDSARALALVDESLRHTPTSPDTYMLKARIYKHAGDPLTAHGYMETARRLDTQDRYLNTKCVRYALRADQLRAAEETVALFLRDGDGLGALEELQVCWYENGAAELHMRARQWGRALKKLRAIDKHFSDMYEDQFDFHSYCLRKTTLRAYIEMVRWEDSMRAHRFHVRAALNLVRVYLRLFDAPREEAADLDALAAEQGMSEEEKKEHAKRAKKAAQKARAAEEKKAAAEAAEKAAANKGKAAKDVDADPDGLELLKADPLVEATRIMQHLAQSHAHSIDTHALGVALYLRKGKLLLALRHVKKALALDANHPDTHFALCSFLHEARKECAGDKIHAVVKEVVEAEIASLSKGMDVSALNSSFLSSHSSSLAHRVSAARVLVVLEPVSARAEATRLASQLDAAESFSRADAEAALLFLSDSLKASTETLDAFRATALKKFPLAIAFGAKPCPPAPVDAQLAQ